MRTSQFRSVCVLCGMAALLNVAASGVCAQTAEADLQAAVRSGTLAALAPLCGLRDSAWAEDLRKSAIQDATRSLSPRDDALKAAPGSDLVTGALGYAETEALEDFAEKSPEAACAEVRANPDLPAADARVETYRRDLARARAGS